jgi:hypothetical protein
MISHVKENRWLRALLAAVLPAAFITSAGLLTGSAPALAATCPYTGYHYNAEATSGAGTNQGTGALMKTWSSWSLDGHTASSGAFSDEAVWTIDNKNSNDALEVGFNVGVGATDSVYENYMYPYYTTDNGGNETDFTGTILPTDTDIWNSATSNGTDSWAYVNNKLLKEIPYGVPTPRLNYEQVEVDYHDIWMGGGSGSDVALEYQSSNGDWYDWGYIDGSTNTYAPGGGSVGPAGYGYFIDLDQPNGADEGGYGQSC